MPCKGRLIFILVRCVLDLREFGRRVIDGDVDVANVEFYCWDELDTGDLGDCVENLGAVPCREDEGSESAMLAYFSLRL